MGAVLEGHRGATVDVSSRGLGARVAARRPSGDRTHRRLRWLLGRRRNHPPRRQLARRCGPHLRTWQCQAVGMDPCRSRRRRRPRGGDRGITQAGPTQARAASVRSLPHRRKGLARKSFTVAANADNARRAALATGRTHRRPGGANPGRPAAGAVRKPGIHRSRRGKAVCTNTEQADIHIELGGRHWSVLGTGHAEVGLRGTAAPAIKEGTPA